MAPLAIRILTANSCTRWRWIFKGLSQDEGWADFSENFLDSLFNDDEPTCIQIHLAGQYFQSRNLRPVIPGIRNMLV